MLGLLTMTVTIGNVMMFFKKTRILGTIVTLIGGSALAIRTWAILKSLDEE